MRSRKLFLLVLVVFSGQVQGSGEVRVPWTELCLRRLLTYASLGYFDPPKALLSLPMEGFRWTGFPGQEKKGVGSSFWGATAISMSSNRLHIAFSNEPNKGQTSFGLQHAEIIQARFPHVVYFWPTDRYTSLTLNLSGCGGVADEFERQARGLVDILLNKLPEALTAKRRK